MEQRRLTGQEIYENEQQQKRLLLQALYFTDRREQPQPKRRASRELAAFLGSCARSHTAHGRMLTGTKPSRAERAAWVQYILRTTT